MHEREQGSCNMEGIRFTAQEKGLSLDKIQDAPSIAVGKKSRGSRCLM